MTATSGAPDTRENRAAIVAERVGAPPKLTLAIINEYETLRLEILDAASKKGTDDDND